MLTFFGIAFLIYGGMHLYALAKVWQAFPHSSQLGAVLVLLCLLLTLSPFFLFFAARQGWHSVLALASWPIYLWMGFLFLFCAIGFVFDSGSFFFALLNAKWQSNGLHALLAVSLLALMATSYGFYDARQMRIERITITTPKLMRGKVTIAQISDLHLGTMLGDAFIERIVAKLCEIKPDILVATGDIVDGEGDNMERLAQHLRACAAPKANFAVLGNHEYYAGMENSLRFLRDAGFTVLRGEAVEAEGIVFAGVDDPSGLLLNKDTRLNAEVALKAMPKDAFVVLLKHQPAVDSTTPFDLQLSGHIHGGQIFPFNLFTYLVYKVHTGLTQLARGRWLYVSRGAGTWGPPIRLLAAPEIAMITIEASQKH